MIPSAYLRVFRPLDTFPEHERAGWERYILAGGPPPILRPIYRHEIVSGDGTVGLLAPPSGDHADIRLVDGEYFISPWRTRLRILSAIVSLRDTAPAEMPALFAPDAEVRRASRELGRMRRRDPSAVPAMLQSPWHVPLRWFVLVDDDERHLVEIAPGRYRLYYWTPILGARRRADRARQVVRRTELASIADLIGELAEWLSRFHPRSVVELDYASVSGMFSWDELDNDHSGREIQEAISVLSRPGGMPRAAELYQQVAARWAETMSKESLN